MTRVYLIRHAEAEGNLYRRYHGWYNSLITDKGYQQIEALEKRFAGVEIDAVYSSDLFRTMTTAGAIYKPRGLTLHTDRDLREIHGGVWEDKTWGAIWRENPRGLEAFNCCDPAWRVEGSDTFDALQTRVVGAIRRIAARHSGQTIAIVAHGTAIRASLAKFMGYSLNELTKVPHGDNTAVSMLTVGDDGGVDVCFFNDNSHLVSANLAGKQFDQRKGEPIDIGMVELWFCPLDFKTQARLYEAAREDAWRLVHGGTEGYDGPGLLSQAAQSAAAAPWSVLAVMRKDEVVGVLQMEPGLSSDGKGHIPFFYLAPTVRRQGMGVQLLGQAVSWYRPQGAAALSLRCAQENEAAQRFYLRYGFHKAGEEAGSLGRLDRLEKYIGYGEN